MCHRLIALISVLLLAGSALADSKYRVVGVEPVPWGARLKISYENTPAGGKAAAVDTIKASLFIYTANPSGGFFIAAEGGRDQIFKTGDLRKPGAIAVGKFADWKGTGVTRVDLDYGKLGLKPGQQIWTGVNFFWDKWGHSWGDHKAGRGSGGPHTLPEMAQKNSALWRSPSRPRDRGAGRLQNVPPRGTARVLLRAHRFLRRAR